MMSTLLKNLRHPLRVKWHSWELNPGLLGSPKDDQICHWRNQIQGYCAKTTYPEYYWNQEHTVNIYSEETVRSWQSKPTERKHSSHTHHAFAKFRSKRLRKEVLRRTLTKNTLAQFAERKKTKQNMAVNAEPVSIENSTLFSQRQKPAHFCLKPTLEPTQHMWPKNRFEFSWMESVILPEGQGTRTRWVGSTWVLLDGCEKAVPGAGAHLRGGGGVRGVS